MAGWLAGWLAGLLAGGLAGGLAGRTAGWPAGRRGVLLADLSIRSAGSYDFDFSKTRSELRVSMADGHRGPVCFMVRVKHRCPRLGV